MVGGDDDGFNGALLTEAYDVPARLTNTRASLSLAKDAESPLTLVFFGYTRCPDVCQMVISIASSLQRLDPDERDRIDVVFVTTDPARDDAATLATTSTSSTPVFTGLTGDLPAITRQWASGVYIARGQELPDGGYEVNHQHAGRRGCAPTARRRSRCWTQGTSSAKHYAEDIQHLLGEGATP